MIKKEFLRFTLSAIVIYLTSGALNPAGAAPQPSFGNRTHFCGVIDGQSDKRYSDQFPNRRYARSSAANLNVGEPRTVRMIYFLPNDRPYRANVVQKMKDEILSIQTFYAEQMEVHGYGKVTFRVETDPQGEPMVHQVDGQHPDRYYEGHGDRLNNSGVINEIDQMFDRNVNIYFIIIDNSAGHLRGGGGGVAKNGGFALLTSSYFWAMGHELGHAFGLQHDFSDGAYIMSYGWGAHGTDGQLSPCHAEYLSVHPYFNLNTPTEEGEPPTIELISSPLYPAGSRSVPVRLKVNDSEGLHQLLLFVSTIEPHSAAGFYEVKACRGLLDDRDTVVEFDYDGVIPSDGLTSLSDPVIHPIYVEAVDTDGDVGYASFGLVEISPHHITTFDEHTSRVSSVAFSSDERTLASGSHDGTVKLWDVEMQQDIGTLPHGDGITSVAFSPDGRTIASGAWDGKVKLWSVATQQDSGTLPHGDGITSVAFSPDGRTIASGAWDGKVKLWSVATQQDIGTLPHGDGITSVAFSPDGRTIASGAWDGKVKLWSVATQQDIGTLPHGAEITSVAFSPVDATLLATGSRDRTVKLWNVATRQNIATFEEHTSGVRSVVFSRDGSTLATGSWDRTVKLWDVTTRVNFATLGHGDPVRSVAFSSDDTTLASGTEVGTVELWDTSMLMGVRLEATAEIDVPDPNLHAAIAEAIRLSPNTPIFQGHLENLTRLEARNANINDLTGLEGATNLRTLDLGGNSVSDISAVAGLTKLTRLYLVDNSISDISAVAGLTSLTDLNVDNNNVSDISAVVGLTNLTSLNLGGSSVSDISAVAGLTKLTRLYLVDNSISDISAVAGLTSLTDLNVDNNNVSDISAVAGLTQLTRLTLWNNSISDISAVAGLTSLTDLNVDNNNVSDISVVVGLTNLTSLNLGGSSVSDISAVSGLTNLTRLTLRNNSISDISAVAGLTSLTDLNVDNNNVSDISAVAVLTNLTILGLWNNNISDISPLVENTGLGAQGWGWVGVRENPLSYQSIHTHIPILQSRGVTVDFDDQARPTLLKILGDNQRRLPGETLAYPFVVEARDENGSPFAGVSVTFTVTEGGGTLSIISTMTNANGRAESTLTLGPNFGTNTVQVSAAGIEVRVTFNAIGDTPEFLWSIPPGYSLIHVPLKVTAVDDVLQTLTSIADLYDALGGAGTVNLLATYDSRQGWFNYVGPTDRGTVSDKVLFDDTGILASLAAPVSITLKGDPLGTSGTSTVTLNPNINLVGLPLRDSRITRVSDLFALEGIGGNAGRLYFTVDGTFKSVGQAGDPGDIEVTGGQSFIMTAQQAATVTISGDGWYNSSAIPAAPLVGNGGLHSLLTGIQVTDTTPVLALRGSIADEGIDTNRAGFRVIVKNLSTGSVVATPDNPLKRGSDKGQRFGRPLSGGLGIGYQATIVDVETARAARIGDILQISAQSPDPLIGVQPLQYTVTAEDVKRSLIQLPALVAYEIPMETELLHNYPNPFNPETWIPYRLAEDAFVTLTIYDLSGQVVRTLDVGHRIAAVYEGRSKAAYWDGRNGLGEQVASGIYFYTLMAGDYSATRKMVILK